MANPGNIEPYKWKPGQSGNPDGLPKGSKHLSTWIQEMLNDDTFSFKVRKEPKGQTEEYTGAPIQAIIGVAIYRSMLGDKDAREWLAKHGYGTKLIVGTEDPVEAALRKLGLMPEGDDAGQDQGSTEKTS